MNLWPDCAAKSIIDRQYGAGIVQSDAQPAQEPVCSQHLPPVFAENGCDSFEETL